MVFQAGSEFLVCKREEELIEGQKILNVYLREIQLGFNKDVVLWLNDKLFDKVGNFTDVENQVGQKLINEFDSDSDF